MLKVVYLVLMVFSKKHSKFASHPHSVDKMKVKLIQLDNKKKQINLRIHQKQIHLYFHNCTYQSTDVKNNVYYLFYYCNLNTRLTKCFVYCEFFFNRSSLSVLHEYLLYYGIDYYSILKMILQFYHFNLTPQERLYILTIYLFSHEIS